MGLSHNEPLPVKRTVKNQKIFAKKKLETIEISSFRIGGDGGVSLQPFARASLLLADLWYACPGQAVTPICIRGLITAAKARPC